MNILCLFTGSHHLNDLISKQQMITSSRSEAPRIWVFQIVCGSRNHTRSTESCSGARTVLVVGALCVVPSLFHFSLPVLFFGRALLFILLFDLQIIVLYIMRIVYLHICRMFRIWDKTPYGIIALSFRSFFFVNWLFFLFLFCTNMIS